MRPRPTPVTSHGQPLARLRWAVRGAFTLGMAASVAANILHAPPHPISQVIAAWPSLALMCTVEIMSRVPPTRRGLAITRTVVTAAIALIAAYVSYFHMVGVAARYGETGVAAYLLPFSVDGLVVVASISLVDITAHLAQTGQPSVRNGRTTAVAARLLRVPQPDGTALRSHVGPLPRAARSTGGRARGGPPAFTSGHTEPCQADDAQTVPSNPQAGSPADADDRAQIPVPEAVATRDAVEYWLRHDATLHPKEIAARIGRSERTVRRHLRAALPSVSP